MQRDHRSPSHGHSHGQPQGPPAAPERGIAIIISLVFVMIVLGLVTSGTLFLKSTQTRSELHFRIEGQANQFARSGLTEALAWFRRQTAQPVTAFAPALDTGAVPQVLDTDEPDIGLVREFQIEGDIWGRYEVWKEWDADPDPQRLAWRKQAEVKDISSDHGFVGAGNVWLVRSVGYVFRRRSSTAAFNVKPNRVLASVKLESEIQRLSLVPPGQSAVSIRRADGATINSNGRIVGGMTGSAIFAPNNTNAPTLNAGSDVTGSPAVSYIVATDYDDGAKAVFGVSLQELRSMANTVVTSSGSFPDPVPQNTLLFSDAGALTFDSTKTLSGMAVVYVKGNVTINSGSDSSFNGLLYIDGDLTMREPSEIHGAVVVTGNLLMQGAGDFATITYDDDVLSALRTQVGQYRWAGATREIEL